MTKTRIERHFVAQRIVFLLFLIIILCSIVGAQVSPVARALGRGEKIPVLVFGVDAADASQHTDTLMVTVIDDVQYTVGVLSIPRDTRIDLPGYRFNRINEIYGYHLRKSKNREKSAKEVLAGVEYLLSSDDSPISVPYFIQLDFSGFRKMVDILGGIWVTIKQSMHYDDFSGDYHFHKEQGRYLMSGKEALQYVRFRGQTGDRGRILRQQEFIRSMIKRFANPLKIIRLPEMAVVFKTSVLSNLSFWDAVYLTMACRRVRTNSVGFYILPGSPAGAYWSPKKQMVQRLAGILFRGEKAHEGETETITPQADRITVNVWNASGKKGWGYRLTKDLRERGYDVVDWGNYPTNQLQTRVIDRTGILNNARIVAGDLGVDSFHSEPNPKVMVDVEVVIGKNYRGFGN
jgi:polyisoprenyl-teichoic acid--peptidoglycan teichoic acid transferase